MPGRVRPKRNTARNPALWQGGLEALGGNLYRETVASGEAVEGVPGEEGLGLGAGPQDEGAREDRFWEDAKGADSAEGYEAYLGAYPNGRYARLAEALLEDGSVRALVSSSDVLVPVPLPPRRLRERGYNQSWELIKALRRQATDTRALALSDALVRIGNAPDQHPLPREQRLRNLQGSFVAHPHHVARLQKTHVLLVDDVSTTGTTLNSAAQALLKAGTGRVSALVLARTSGH